MVDMKPKLNLDSTFFSPIFSLDFILFPKFYYRIWRLRFLIRRQSRPVER